MLDGSVTEPRSMAMQDQVNAAPELKRVPWNKGKLTGAKPPLRPKHVWSIRTKLQIEGRCVCRKSDSAILMVKAAKDRS